VAEQFTQEAADAAIAEGARICLRRGRQIANVTALAGATPIYSVRRFLGRDGERWIATNAIFPISRAVEVTRATEAFFAARQAEIERHRLRIGYISQVTPVHWQIEPLFYWWDELEELHFRHLPEAEATRFRALRAEPWGRDMALIALTGWGHPDDKRRASEAGFDLHLTKPVDPAELEELLRSPDLRGEAAARG
jgi:nucleotide-binding universal stress UspA family protein